MASLSSFLILCMVVPIMMLPVASTANAANSSSTTNCIHVNITSNSSSNLNSSGCATNGNRTQRREGGSTASSLDQFVSDHPIEFASSLFVSVALNGILLGIAVCGCVVRVKEKQRRRSIRVAARYREGAAVESGDDYDNDDEDEDPSPSGLHLLFCGICLALSSVMVRYRARRYAPRDASQPFAVVFTDIESSTALWAAAPLAMSAAVEHHHLLIRSLIHRWHGYEVKTIGDSFMVVFQRVECAVQFSLALQRMFADAAWPPEIDEVYEELRFAELNERRPAPPSAPLPPPQPPTAALPPSSSCALQSRLSTAETVTTTIQIEDEHHACGSDRCTPNMANDVGGGVDDDYDHEEPSAVPLWNGLRVRIGMHWGHGMIQLDPTTHRYDYYGTVVNTAARVESVGHGGQILMTNAVFEAMERRSGGSTASASQRREAGVPWESFVTRSLGPQCLRGLPEPVLLMQMLPISLQRREFRPLRFDKERFSDDRKDEGGHHLDLTGEATNRAYGCDNEAHFLDQRGCMQQYGEDDLGTASGNEGGAGACGWGKRCSIHSFSHQQESGGAAAALPSSRPLTPAAPPFARTPQEVDDLWFASYQSYAESLLIRQQHPQQTGMSSPPPLHSSAFATHIVHIARLWRLTLSTVQSAKQRNDILALLCQKWNIPVPLVWSSVAWHFRSVMMTTFPVAGGPLRAGASAAATRPLSSSGNSCNRGSRTHPHPNNTPNHHSNRTTMMMLPTEARPMSAASSSSSSSPPPLGEEKRSDVQQAAVLELCTWILLMARVAVSYENQRNATQTTTTNTAASTFVKPSPHFCALPSAAKRLSLIGVPSFTMAQTEITNGGGGGGCEVAAWWVPPPPTSLTAWRSRHVSNASEDPATGGFVEGGESSALPAFGLQPRTNSFCAHLDGATAIALPCTPDDSRRGVGAPCTHTTTVRGGGAALPSSCGGGGGNVYLKECMIRNSNRSDRRMSSLVTDEEMLAVPSSEEEKQEELSSRVALLERRNVYKSRSPPSLTDG